MTTPGRIALVLFASLVPAAAVRADEPAPSPLPLSPGLGKGEGVRGVVFVAGGIGGVDPLQTWTRVVLPLAGVPHEVRIFEWTHGKFHMLRDEQDLRYLQDRAAELADLVRAVKAEDPSRPVFLIGHSAGAALILETAAQLPPATIERMILLSTAVSPTYDLRPALRATRGELVAFYSPLDLFMLHFGTTMFGTVDRYYVDAAGMQGFRKPDGLDDEGRRLYARLVQSGWRPEMYLMRRCWHNSTCMPLFLGREVAPWLTRPVGADVRVDP